MGGCGATTPSSHSTAIHSFSGIPAPSTISCLQGISNSGGSTSHGLYSSMTRQNKARSLADVAIGPSAPNTNKSIIKWPKIFGGPVRTYDSVHSIVRSHEPRVWHAAD